MRYCWSESIGQRRSAATMASIDGRFPMRVEVGVGPDSGSCIDCGTYG